MIVIVYDNNGDQHKKESIDARECIDILGWTLHPVTVKESKRKSKQQFEDGELLD